MIFRGCPLVSSTVPSVMSPSLRLRNISGEHSLFAECVRSTSLCIFSFFYDSILLSYLFPDDFILFYLAVQVFLYFRCILLFSGPSPSITSTLSCFSVFSYVFVSVPYNYQVESYRSSTFSFTQFRYSSLTQASFRIFILTR